MRIKFEGTSPDGGKITIRKKVFMMRNIDSVVERLKFTCNIWTEWRLEKKEKDSHQR